MRNVTGAHKDGLRMGHTIRNATQQLVLAEVEARKSSRLREESGCWCEGCTQDVIALALSSLPPHYCTRFNWEEALQREGALWVQETVSRSLERVTRHPKHGRLNADSTSRRFRLVNFSFEECESVISEVLLEEEDACTCPRCRDDVMAYALNRYPPKYGVARNGEVNFPGKEREMIRRELSAIVSAASEVVARKPRHGE